jgi:hypothetical protein
MIVQENLIINGRKLVKTYSDNAKYIIQNETGVEYTEAVDVPNKYTYTESETIIEEEESKPEVDI